MAMGFDDEFDYLDDSIDGLENTNDNSLSSIISIKGSKTEEEQIEEEQKVIEEPIKEEEPAKKYDSLIFVVKVTTNKEDKAMEMIVDKVLKKNVDVYAIARPHGVRGYIFLESPDRENAEEAVYNLPYVKGILPNQVVMKKYLK